MTDLIARRAQLLTDELRRLTFQHIDVMHNDRRHRRRAIAVRTVVPGDDLLNLTVEIFIVTPYNLLLDFS